MRKMSTFGKDSLMLILICNYKHSMKNYLTFLITLLFVSCDDKSDSMDENTPQGTSTNIEGKWNLEKYIDMDGIEHPTTYIIFVWYEQGFEFIGKDEFYPRYDPKVRFDSDEWQTSYLAGPGTYVISNNILTLSDGNVNYDYQLKVIDENTIELSNDDTRGNQWTGKCILTKE